MIDDNIHTLVNTHSGELAFKLYDFDRISHFDHIQRLNYYSLIWIKKGEGEVSVDCNLHKYKENHLFTFVPYQPFMFKAKSKTEGVIIHFHADFFCIHKHQSEVSCNGVLFNNIYSPPFVIVDEKYQLSLDWIIKEMEKDILEHHFASSDSILSYLKLFLIQCSRLKNDSDLPVENTQVTDEHVVAKQLKSKIEQHYRKQHAPKAYADMLNITPKALARISRNHFNKTLTTLIAERIVIEAKRELYLTDKSVKTIAYELGYDDEYYFSRFFKRNTNISPSTYRKTVGFNKTGTGPITITK